MAWERAAGIEVKEAVRSVTKITRRFPATEQKGKKMITIEKGIAHIPRPANDNRSFVQRVIITAKSRACKRVEISMAEFLRRQKEIKERFRK